MNSLLDCSGLPRFSDFKIEEISLAIDVLLAQNRALIEKSVAADTSATWENFIQPLEEAGERLHRVWGQVSHLNAVLNSPELRDAYNGNLPKISQYYTEIAPV
jgi:oligopeptidase A